MRRTLLIAMLVLAGCQKQPPGEPLLRVETGMHTGRIWSAAADPSSRFVVTGSEDKTVRVWDSVSGELLQTLRVPSDGASLGQIFAVAVSPDGKHIAAAGSTGTHIYFFERETGALVQTLNATGTVYDLDFSPDGTRLAFLLESGAAGVVETSGLWRYLEWIADCTTEGARIDLEASGKLAVSCLDGAVRLYDAAGEKMAEIREEDRWPWGVWFSPDGSTVAVGYLNAGGIDLLSGTDLSRLGSARTTDMEGATDFVAWSGDGSLLYAAGGSRLHVWDEAGTGSRLDFSIEDAGTILGFDPLSDGRLAFVSTTSWGVLNPADGKVVLRHTEQARLAAGASLLVGRAGSPVQIALPSGEPPTTFSVEELAFEPDPAPGDPLQAPRTEAPDLAIADWQVTAAPTLNGEPLALDPHEYAYSLAIDRDGETFLLGTSHHLRLYDRTGRQRWATPLPARAGAVNLSPDGRLALAFLLDGTVCWFRTHDGKLLLSLFLHADRKRWVAWTPSGYYAASEGGEDLVGWHQNRGLFQAADWFDAAQFRERNRRDVVTRVLATLDEAQALADADAEALRMSQQTALASLQTQQPLVRVISPLDGVKTQETSLTFQVGVSSPSGEEVLAVRAYVDGSRVATTALRDVVLQDPADPRSESIHTFLVPVPRRDCTVSIAAETRFANSAPVPVKVRWSAPEPAAERPDLYLLAVGVSQYEKLSQRLSFPAKDATDFAQVWQAQAGRLYGKVEVRVLTDAQATRNAIEAGLEWLEIQTTRKDMAVVFFAGHGANDLRTGAYHFFPHEADLAARRTTLLPDRDVVDALGSIQGKALLFVDTCHSGNLFGVQTRGAADVSGLMQELASTENGVVMFAASSKDQVSQERASWHNGAFTKAVLEALQGRADTDGNGSVWTAEIASYVDKRVRELTGGLQTPVFGNLKAGPNFPVAALAPP